MLLMHFFLRKCGQVRIFARKIKENSYETI